MSKICPLRSKTMEYHQVTGPGYFTSQMWTHQRSKTMQHGPGNVLKAVEAAMAILDRRQRDKKDGRVHGLVQLALQEYSAFMAETLPASNQKLRFEGVEHRLGKSIRNQILKAKEIDIMIVFTATGGSQGAGKTTGLSEETKKALEDLQCWSRGLRVEYGLDSVVKVVALGQYVKPRLALEIKFAITTLPHFERRDVYLVQRQNRTAEVVDEMCQDLVSTVLMKSTTTTIALSVMDQDCIFGSGFATHLSRPVTWNCVVSGSLGNPNPNPNPNPITL
jgi:hypothetical protein